MSPAGYKCMLVVATKKWKKIYNYSFLVIYINFFIFLDRMFIYLKFIIIIVQKNIIFWGENINIVRNIMLNKIIEVWFIKGIMLFLFWNHLNQ